MKRLGHGILAVGEVFAAMQEAFALKWLRVSSDKNTRIEKRKRQAARFEGVWRLKKMSAIICFVNYGAAVVFCVFASAGVSALAGA